MAAPQSTRPQCATRAKLNPEQVKAVRAWYQQRLTVQQVASRLRLPTHAVRRIAAGVDVAGVSADDASQIRSWWTSRSTMQDEAARYGLSVVCFASVAKGRTYRWVESEGDPHRRDDELAPTPTAGKAVADGTGQKSTVMYEDFLADGARNKSR